jgi:hypothetical protein
MINILWMLYIALMLCSTVLSIIGIIEERESHRSSVSLAIIIVFTCILWSGFIVYYL